MRVFACPNCGAWVEFEDRVCLACDTELAYAPAIDDLLLAEGLDLCVFRDDIGCNWIADADPRSAQQCSSCRLTTRRPPVDDLAAWSQLTLTEYPKRRLVRQLNHLGLPVIRREGDSGLAFELRSPTESETVLTGHADGVITINLAEAGDARREEVRISLGEPYRTILGHLRHEIGHYYWLALVAGTPDLTRFRRLFGDDRQDYGDALDSHYGGADSESDAGAGGGDPADAPPHEDHISDYATMHPWEDFAESFAHYLHIADGLETAATVGVYIAGPSGVSAPLAGSITSSGAASIAELAMPEILARWHGFALGMNAMNRSMGEPDLYPFVITAAVAEKLDYVHTLVRGASGR
ncbi:MAG: hypothetical protein JWP66_145 [Naasia sp.]|nr:hypothetical protein [Naasia sp.]